MAATSTIDDVLSGNACWCVHHGDVLDVLPTMPENSVDAVVCDAPYGLGEHLDAVTLLRAWLDDLDVKTNARGFMGRKWDTVPGPRYWRELYRVLKPGGYLLTFAGTRTEDLMGMAIRLAGFERRDTIAWLYSQGMSKNANVERYIAMHQCTLPGRHVDACRIEASKSDMAELHATVEAIRNRGGTMDNSWKNSSDLAMANPVNPAGRWPKNVLLEHVGGPGGCTCRGTTTVAANPTWDTPNRDTEPSAFTGERVSKVRHGRDGEASAERRYDGEGSTSFAATPGPRRDAVEDVPVWECVDGCAVAALDGMCWPTKSGKMPAGTLRSGGSAVALGEFNGATTKAATIGDQGGVSRFFTQLQPCEFDAPPFLYQAKPSRREKNAGLQHFRPRSGAEATGSNDDDERLNNARTGNGRTGGARNIHPTTKSVKLSEWLCKLVARPGQLVLVPFAGGGSECIGALMAGCRVIGIELNDTDDEPFVSIAKARLEHFEGREYVPRESLQAPPELKPRQGVLF